MENLDPVGIHTGDSIVVCPSQTLTNKEYHMLRDSALKIIRALEIEGGCNVQFALDPKSFQYYLIEVNPRVSRSSALASKASGYPIARVSAKIGIGMTLDEIMLANTPALFEPALDYIVTKIPRFPFDKFADANNSLNTQMKATGEVMAIGRSFEESLLKAIRSLEIGLEHIYNSKFDEYSNEQLLEYIKIGTDDRIYAIAALLRNKIDINTIANLTAIDMFFLKKIENIIEQEIKLKENPLNIEILKEAKQMGFSDKIIGQYWHQNELDIRNLRKENNILPVYKMIDSCASEFSSYIPYFYSTYEDENESIVSKKEKIIVLGSGPIRIGQYWHQNELDIRNLRKENNILPVYKMIDSCASEFSSYIPYFYSTYEDENESIVSKKEKIIVLGSGPIRIGQGVEFDYSTVHAVSTIKNAGYEAIIINNNPETVSTDYTCSDKLYFEPLCVEDVMNIIELEKPIGVIATLGGQTAINLANPLSELGVKLIGTDCTGIERAENRDVFEKLLDKLNIPQAKGKAVTNVFDGLEVASEIGYPVLVRPSFVLGGRAMQIINNDEQLKHYLKTAVEIDEDKPVLVDKYIRGKEVEVDAICDGKDVFIPGIMELVERTGIHSGDSISVYPTFSISEKVKNTIKEYTTKLGLGIGIIGLFNIQFIVDKDENVYIIEVNPRSSRTVPFLSKVTKYSLADIATYVILGKNLKEQGIIEMSPEHAKKYYVKVPTFSFSKLSGMDTYLSPEMKSTGEAIGYDKKLHRAMYKALIASGMSVANYGTIFVTIANEDKEEALPLIKRFYDMGFNIEATVGTANFLKEKGIKTRIRKKISEGSNEILESIRAGYVSYVINTRSTMSSPSSNNDGVIIRQCAIQNGVTVLTSLDTVKVILDVLEETTISISKINDYEKLLVSLFVLLEK